MSRKAHLLRKLPPSSVLLSWDFPSCLICTTASRMPSRKSNSSETQPDSRRSSLRRLSSFASFPTLFARRRGPNASDATAASSSSNLSLSVSCTTNDAPGSSTAATSNLPREDSIAELAQPTPERRQSSKQDSYVCLPDDPIGGMPRSRTFSNLPVPVKARKSSNLSQFKSHAHLPSTFASTTRLPSPPTSIGGFPHSRLASIESKVPVMRNRVKRSDTEPLLPTPVEQANNFGRSTAFKENLTLSPVKPLPAMDMTDRVDASNSTKVSETKAKRRSWRASIEERGDSTSSAFEYVNPYAGHPAVQIAREHRSSPAYKGMPQRKPLPRASIPQPVQRWHSQPVLANVTNNQRHLQHGEIRQTRLMAARQAPTPPVSKTPVAWEAARTDRMKSTSVSASNLLHLSEDARNLSHSSITSSKPNPLAVSMAGPAAYWAGRLCALTDRFRNEELATQLMSASSSSSSGLTPKGQTDKMHTPEASTARTKRALEHLSELCITLEAKESMLQFQAAYAKQTGLPELAPAKPATRTIVLGSIKNEDSGAGEAADKSTSENRKVSFMDRLLGRQKRRSLVLA